MNAIIAVTQLFFTVVIGLYFFNQLRSQQSGKSSMDKESRRELEKLHKLRKIALTRPLSEITRPDSFGDIVGQNDGLKALKAALCGPNPQHIIIYGPPGVGKTAAARLTLEEAKRQTFSPFKKDAGFIESDATTLHFDERGIADPLIGSVHDPIYQGAGAYGPAGVPQPKPGAVSKAHGGVLFIDEIGELHHIQLNKLLKVLEDRKVWFESAYYNADDKNIPRHIHDIFQNGMPADFRLIGATTRSPEEISPAIRSRCVEIFFRPLSKQETEEIARRAVTKGAFGAEEGVEELVSHYAQNGRDAVNIVQTAGSAALIDGRSVIEIKDVEWVINSGHYTPHTEKKAGDGARIGCVNGLAVGAMSFGRVMELEAIASGAVHPELTVTGIVEQEELDGRGNRLRRTSMARASVDNVLTVLKEILNFSNLKLHLNFPGGAPVDGPSAGIAILAAIYSAAKRIPVSDSVAMTGEISINGRVLPVGGVSAKLEAALRAGIKTVFIPKANYQDMFREYPLEIVCIDHVKQLIERLFSDKPIQAVTPVINEGVLTAKPN